jgi:hypothetical protein
VEEDQEGDPEPVGCTLAACGGVLGFAEWMLGGPYTSCQARTPLNRCCCPTWAGLKDTFLTMQKVVDLGVQVPCMPLYPGLALYAEQL